ncbi:MBL fold metallo-hydrolase [Spirochaetia bacterium]|nr:MBL fold metallo-hydrolase [Spirochaetia bacterium]
MGSGTSHGVPVIGCSCPVCTSTDKRDARFRSSLYIKGKNGERIVVDTGPEFRLQAVRAGIDHLDALLLTHSHADHLHGLDDIRPLTWEKPLPIFANGHTIKEVEDRFAYIWQKTQRGGGKPRVGLNEVTKPWSLNNIKITPIPVFHGNLSILGWKFKEDEFEAAYITDCSRMPDTSFEMLDNISLLIIGSLRMEKHETHYSFDESLELVHRLAQREKTPKLKQVYFTHIAHSYSHKLITKYCKEQCKKLNITGISVKPAFDMLKISSW